MIGPIKVAARRGMPLLALVTAAAAAVSPAQATLLAQSWNGYHWAHTGNLAILVGNNTSAGWSSYLNAAAAKWSTDKYIDYIPMAGMSHASSCAAMYGTVQVCSGNYGSTGWAGYTQVWTAGTSIYQATIKLNEYYFSKPQYNNVAFRQQVICQELGNALGLQDSDHNFGNVNVGSCMDYTNDPSGKKGTNGTRANTTVSGTDFSHLDTIYAKRDSTQLVFTKPGMFGNAQAVPGSVPEPSSWLMMLGGFGVLGFSMRRRRISHAHA